MIRLYEPRDEASFSLFAKWQKRIGRDSLLYKMERTVINVASVEDEADERARLVSFLKRYEKENEVSFHVFEFANAISFLSFSSSPFDIVFMDVRLPDINGFETAKKYRKTDDSSALIFVTNLAQYAIKGYEVNAIDFIVKPLLYETFVVKLERALSIIKEKEGQKIVVKIVGGFRTLSSMEITYVEVYRHTITFHTVGDSISTRGTLKKIRSLLPKENFVLCNSCYLVNLRYVDSVNGYSAVVRGNHLNISYHKKQEFLRALNNYFGGGRGV